MLFNFLPIPPPLDLTRIGWLNLSTHPEFFFISERQQHFLSNVLTAMAYCHCSRCLSQNKKKYVMWLRGYLCVQVFNDLPDQCCVSILFFVKIRKREREGDGELVGWREKVGRAVSHCMRGLWCEVLVHSSSQPTVQLWTSTTATYVLAYVHVSDR